MQRIVFSSAPFQFNCTYVPPQLRAAQTVLLLCVLSRCVKESIMSIKHNIHGSIAAEFAAVYMFVK